MAYTQDWDKDSTEQKGMTDEEKQAWFAHQDATIAKAKEGRTDYGRVLELEVELKVGQFTRWLEGATPFDVTGEV